MIREAAADQADEICRMILASFEVHAAADYSEEGKAFFRSISGAEDCRRRLRGRNPAWVHQDDDGAITGYLELRDVHHVTRFFVAPHRLGEGIGRRLHDQAESHCRAKAMERMTVFSSPFAVPVYERLGYATTGPEGSPNGLRYVPMEKLLVLVDF